MLDMPPGQWSRLSLQSSGLVQLTVLRHHWRVDATSAVGEECCGQTDHWHTMMWPHLTGVSPAALASSATARQLEIAMLVHVPSYLADDCRLVTDAGVRRLRSADTQTLVVGRTQSSFGDRTFAAAAPRLWNSLLSDIRQHELSYGQFRRSLKTFLFGYVQCDLC